MKSRLQIGVIIPPSMDEKTIKVFGANANVDLIIKKGILDQAYKIALDMQNNKTVDAVITIGAPMDVFVEPLDIPIYPLYPSNFDIISALFEARVYGEKAAFAEMKFHTTLYDLRRISKILGVDIPHYQFKLIPKLGYKKSVESTVDKIISDGNDVLVTMGSYSLLYAQKLGFPAYMVLPDKYSFRLTIDDIVMTLFEKNMEREKTKWLNAVFESANEGVMVLDNNKNVVAINSAAEKFMRLDKSNIINSPIETVNSENPLFNKFFNTSSNFEIVKGRKHEYAVRKDILFDDTNPLGIVIRANPLQDLQKLELSARRRLFESGLVAKHTFDDIKGSSNKFSKIKETAKKYAAAVSNIILYGESGSGKEIFAQSIHNASPCKEGPFVAINCTALSESLLESELFGYEDGAFTGAKKGGHQGLFELAHKGTLFLDEIGDMPLDVQVKVLRVLQEKTIRRIGGKKNIPIDVRFIFATNKDLLKDIAESRFRKDLYYRINVLSLTIPPLREHIEDIKEISLSFLKQLSVQTGTPFTLSDDACGIMKEYDWPGNIRELTNFLERAMYLGNHDKNSIRAMINSSKNTLSTVDYQDFAGADFSIDHIDLRLDTMQNMEDEIIIATYKRFKGNRKTISDSLNISSSTLYRRLKALGLEGKKDL